MKFSLEILFRLLTVSAITLVISSCGGGHSDKDSGTVIWPELVAFDELAFRAEGFAKVKDRDAILGQRAALVTAGRAVSTGTMPANVANQQSVEQLLTDLSSLVDGLDQSDLPDERLFSLVEGLHPVIASLMEAAGMPHIHANEGPNEGHLHPLFGPDGAQVGTAEIKLHDDAGDIEVWLTRGGHGGPAWDLPVESVLNIKFPGLDKQVDLAVRDQQENRDEAGNVTVRSGATNYFVFPGETGVDASWLMGTEFAAKAVLELDGASSEFILQPHAHHEGEDH